MSHLDIQFAVEPPRQLQAGSIMEPPPVITLLCGDNGPCQTLMAVAVCEDETGQQVDSMQEGPSHQDAYTQWAVGSVTPGLVKTTSMRQGAVGSFSGQYAYFFAFPRLCIRHEGRFQLRVQIFEISSGGGDTVAELCTHPIDVFHDPVYQNGPSESEEYVLELAAAAGALR
ncbi:Velvet factor [Moelleriella libera RCEF 2490]|uniref:Velvet factor n=1 Tax=Moelleriella libera RCEF 2490 TaxID=1081109 RepID=A0A166NQK1_9HYPO|nr:Velvet factor [Moelleriella libera RCEF 2490]